MDPKDKSLHELVINSFDSDLVGEYKCYARNQHGDSSGTATIELDDDQSFSLSLTYAEQTSISPENPHAKISVARGSLEQGNVVELNCALNGKRYFRKKFTLWSAFHDGLNRLF